MNIHWQESSTIGIGAIDAQQRKMINIINGAFAADSDAKAAEKTLQEIKNDYEVSFDTEEMYMLAFGYPKYSKHRAEHEILKEKIKAGAFLTGREAQEFLKAISEELASHITVADKDLAIFFQARKR